MKKSNHSYLLIIGAVLFLVAICVCTLVFLATRDIPPPDTSDLVLERPIVPPEENAYTYFLAATNTLYWPTNSDLVGDYLDGKPVDDAFVQDVIARNSETIAMIEKGLKCRICLTPEVTDFALPVPYPGSLRDIGRVMAAKTRQSRLAAKYTDSTRSCISLMQFGHLVQDGARDPVNYLVGIVILSHGVLEAIELARDGKNAPEELWRLSETLARLGPLERSLVTTWKGEYKAAVTAIDQLSVTNLFSGNRGENRVIVFLLKNKVTRSYLFQPNRTKALFADHCRNMISNAPLCYGDMKLSDGNIVFAPRGTSTKGTKPGLSQTHNAIGKLICAVLIPAHNKILELTCRTECSVAASRLILACNFYDRANGRLPDSLQLLVPKYLPVIPPDPFDGKPFKYLPSKGVVYSVGKDLKDSGGSTNATYEYTGDAQVGRWHAEDAVYQIKETPKQDARKTSRLSR